MLASGTQLGPYKVLGPLGAGGMGEVYRALDKRLGRDVALKILPSRFADDPDRLGRFQREAQAVAALAHPNIVVVHDFGTEHGVTFAVSELLEGQSLQEKLATGALPWRKAVEFATAIADGLAAAHAKGIVHRDIKPANVFVTADERVKILDFGLAKLLVEDTKSEPAQTQDYSPALTQTGAILGTAPYMSPEQLRDQPVDARSDIFSFGCVLYEMVAGNRPFTGKTDAEVTAAILHNDPPELTDSGKKVPVELERLIRRCLEKNPEARFQSARDLAFALRGIASGSGDVPIAPAARPRVNAWLAFGACAFTLLILAFVFWPKNQAANPPDPGKGNAAAPIEVAVLPFFNSTKDAELDYLSDGLPEGINKSLSEVGQLIVRPFNSVSQFRGPVLDLEEMGRKLKVQVVLIGKILPRKDGFTLSVELVKISTNRVVWSERYDTKPADLQTVQLAIARKMCAKLDVTLTAEEEKRFAKRYTENAEAYRLYLLGRHHWYKRTPESFKKAEECFQQAIQMDGQYALAYAGRADNYVAISITTGDVGKMGKAKEAAQKSLDLDEQLAEAHTALGMILFRHEYDWSGAEKELKRGVELNPSLALGWDGYCGYLLRMGRFTEAEQAIAKAKHLDPVTPFISNAETMLHYFTRQFDQAIQNSNKILEVDPNFIVAYHYLGLAHVQKGQYREALAAFQRIVKIDASPNHLALVAYGYALNGDQDAARKLLDELAAIDTQELVDASRLAHIHMALGDKQLACAALEKAYAARSGLLVSLKVDPVFDPLRSEPRFVELMKKMNFP